jgi:antitoxin (DNA-binding transcriptional repressor) of toxin-antitoxin stability system
MHVVGLKVLKNKLSEYVRLAASGERVLVTDRDRVVAELVPPQEGAPAFSADAALAEALRSGLLKPPLLPPGITPGRAPVAPLAQILEQLDTDRSER